MGSSRWMVCTFVVVFGASCDPGEIGALQPLPVTTTPHVAIVGGVVANQSVMGSVVLEANAVDDSGQVAKVEFLVDGSLACADTQPKPTGSRFSCTWDSSTVAMGKHLMTSKAFDLEGNAAASPAISFSVGPATPGNAAPTLTEGPLANPAEVAEKAAVSLSVTATDPEAQPLSYAWTVLLPEGGGGVFSAPTNNVTQWTAPEVTAATMFKIQVEVSDGAGGSVKGMVDVRVNDAVPANQPPTVAVMSLPANPLPGVDVDLTAMATDAEADPLTYAWTQIAGSVQGTFTGAATANAKWRSPAVAAATSVTLQVSVSDGKNAPVLRTVVVQVAVPKFATDIQPIFTARCVACHGAQNPAGGMGLVAGAARAALVGVNSGQCNGLMRVQAGNPAQSALMRKIEPNVVGCNGLRMPRNNATYFDTPAGASQLVQIRSWIMAGALND